jgi:hypothetical protein
MPAAVAYSLLTGKFVFDLPNPTAMLLRDLRTPPKAPKAPTKTRDNGERAPTTLTA